MGHDVPSDRVIDASIADIHDAYVAGAWSAESVVDAYLARIDAYDPTLRAIITVNDRARERAATLDAELASSGLVGPLHGIPVAVKDNQDTHDLPTTLGSEALATSVPPADAFVVQQLRAAGAIVLCKANLQELSYGVDTISSLGGETRNPYALSRRPSGSSGGTAAAVAANLATVGTGTDTCSSVRSPPAFANLVGLRPTRGLVSRSGIAPLSETQDTAGPIARTVADAARMLDVLVGVDPSDPVTALGWRRGRAGSYLDCLDPDGLDGARIGVIRDWFGVQDPDSAPSDAAAPVTAVLETAMETLESAGATLVDPLEFLDRSFVQSARVVRYEFKRDFDRYLADRTAPIETLEALLETGQIAAPIADRIHEARILDVDVSSLSEHTGYLRRLARREELRSRTMALFAEHALDAVLYPPSTIPPVERPEHQPFAELHCELAAHTGFPAIVVPAGFTDDDLPVGVELLGPPFAEPRLLALASAFEAATEHRRPPVGFGPLE